MTSDIARLGVQANQELASQSRPYELLGFASRRQLLVNGVEVRLVAPNDLRNHEQDRADAFAATTQRPSSEMLATIVGDRRQPGELGDGFVGQGTNLRHFGHEAGDGAASYAFAGFEACVDRLYPSMARPTERSDGAAVQAVRG